MPRAALKRSRSGRLPKAERAPRASTRPKAKKSPQALSPRMTALSKLTPYTKNPRVIPDTAVKAVAASLKRFGWKQAIVADPKGVIVAGETRYKAAVSLGWKTAPVVTIPARQARAFRVIDNRTSELTSWDTDLLPDALSGLERPGHLLVRRRITAGGNGRQDGPGRHP